MNIPDKQETKEQKCQKHSGVLKCLYKAGGRYGKGGESLIIPKRNRLLNSIMFWEPYIIPWLVFVGWVKWWELKATETKLSRV